MLSKEKCKEILKEKKKEFTDEEIEEIRAFLYKMAGFVIELENQNLSDNEEF